MRIQAFISNSRFWTPDAVDVVTTKYSNRVPAPWGRRSESKSAFVTLWASVCETPLRAGFYLASVLEHQGICTVSVECGATIDRLNSNDTSMVCKQRIDPPAIQLGQHQHSCHNTCSTHAPARNPRSPSLWDRLGWTSSGQAAAHRFRSACTQRSICCRRLVLIWVVLLSNILQC